MTGQKEERKEKEKKEFIYKKAQMDGQGGGVNPYVNTFFPDDLPHLTD